MMTSVQQLVKEINHKFTDDSKRIKDYKRSIQELFLSFPMKNFRDETVYVLPSLMTPYLAACGEKRRHICFYKGKNISERERYDELIETLYYEDKIEDFIHFVSSHVMPMYLQGSFETIANENKYFFY
ncbi:hypothetical protein [Bacillus cereus]|uniref:hypothetical protein n=1 Tax=Bacillus cereus TaxID=1396 RepID=UPI0018F3F1A1|nr:hypothetical protein [Bacillus cereus]MBJ7935507.1 hypothetical protein [Bacillus cereus]